MGGCGVGVGGRGDGTNKDIKTLPAVVARRGRPMWSCTSERPAITRPSAFSLTQSVTRIVSMFSDGALHFVFHHLMFSIHGIEFYDHSAGWRLTR